jgi:HlyD family secretion protein
MRWVHVAGWLTLIAVAGCAAPAAEQPPPQPPSDVGALGRLEPERKVYQVAPPASFEGARIGRLLVEEGQEVAKGAVLAELDLLGLRRAALAEALSQVEVADARLKLVQAGAKREEVDAQAATVEQMQTSLDHAEANHRRALLLRRTAAMSTEEYDTHRMKLDTARQALAQARATLASLKAVRPEDVALARAELARARAGAARAREEVERCLVTSPISGRVLKVHAREGERVGDKGVAEVGNTACMEAVAEVHEADLPLVRVGQRATVRLRTRGAASFSGTVSQVGALVGRRVVLDNDPVKDADARVVEVRIRLSSDASAAVAGLSYAQVDVVLHTGER